MWGVTIDKDCMSSVIWPAVDTKASGNDPGTWVSTQTGGPSLCGSAKVQTLPGAAPQTKGACPDRIPPVTKLSKHGRTLRIRGGRVSLALGGSSRDTGCKSANLIPARAGVKVVNVSVQKVRGKGRGKNCRFVKRNGKLTGWRNCRKPVLLPARGRGRWTFKKTYRLSAGNYRAVVRASERREG